MRRHGDTRQVDVPYAIAGGYETLRSNLNATAATKTWVQTLGIHPRDNRVVWVYEDDYASLFYREELEPVQDELV